ncbi:MAG: site-specific integrase [Granulicella sp.]
MIGKNGRVKPGWVKVAGLEREYREGKYQLRSYVGAKMVYTDAGEHAGEAMAAREKAVHLLAAKDSAVSAGVKIVEEPSRLNLMKELRRFITATEDRGSSSAAKVYETAAENFLEMTGKTYADELTPEDILKYQRHLRKRGLSDRTVANRHQRVMAFLRHIKLNVKELSPTRPRYEEALPEIYKPEDLKALFDAIDDTDPMKMILELLLKTGLRDQEAVLLMWRDIDLENGVLRVRSKPEYKFKVKDKEQRDIPIPGDLLEKLREYRKHNPSRKLVTGTASDQPNRKLLRSLKRAVKNAGLNCGACATCLKKNKECSQWFLHKFRATYITTLLRSGMDLRTVMKLSGHSDLESVMRYLSPASDDAIKTHVSGVQWM